MRQVIIAASLIFAASATSAGAGVVSLTMENGNGGGLPFNTTAFSLTNLSEPGVALSQMTVTVGDTQCLFDFLYSSEERFTGGDGSQLATLLQGDRTDDNSGPDSFIYGFSGFLPGVSFFGQWDIDYDNLNYNVDLRRVFFNNGDAPNAVVNLVFSDGSTAVHEFADLPIQDSYQIVIPAPGAWIPGAFAAIVIGGRRRDRANARTSKHR